MGTHASVAVPSPGSRVERNLLCPHAVNFDSLATPLSGASPSPLPPTYVRRDSYQVLLYTPPFSLGGVGDSYNGHCFGKTQV